MEHRSMDYADLDAELAAKGYPFLRSQEVLDAVAQEYGMENEHGEVERPYSPSLRAEVYRRLGPSPRKTGRPAIGPEVKTRLTPAEIETVEGLASAAGVDRSEWIRGVIRERLAKVLVDSGDMTARLAYRKAARDGVVEPTGHPFTDLVLTDVMASDDRAAAACEWAQNIDTVMAGREITGRGADAIRAQADLGWTVGGWMAAQGALEYFFRPCYQQH